VALSISPPVRYAALLALVLAVVGGGGFMLMGRSGGDSAAPAHTINPHPFGIKKPSATPVAKPKPETPTAASTPPAKKAREQAPAALAALAAGLPASIANALGRHPVVIVSLFNPYSEVDGIAFAEARAGAKLANVGFVPLNVLSQSQAAKLTETLGLLPDPGVLVYTRPGTLVGKLTGFADKETVAQVAQNAAAHGS
jgi:hypothetical protein